MQIQADHHRRHCVEATVWIHECPDHALAVFRGPGPFTISLLTRRIYVTNFHACNFTVSMRTAWLRRAVEEGGYTRSGLARELCERENWRNEKGDLCLASARRILPKLAAELGLVLPSARERAPRKAPTRDFPNLTLRCGLAEVGEVVLEGRGRRQEAVA